MTNLPPAHAQPTTTCARCAGNDGAHHPWCLLQSFLERLVAPPAPAVTAEQVATIARQTARELVLELVPALPLPVPSPPAEVPARIEPTVPAPRRRVASDKECAADLFLADRVQRDAGGRVTVPELLAAYDAWRPVIGAPPAGARTIGTAMSRAGYTDKEVVRKPDAHRYGGIRPTIYLGVRLRQDFPEAPAPEVEEAGPRCYCDDEGVHCAQHARPEVRPDRYTGPRAGGEVSREYRVAINAWLAEWGPRGFSYAKHNVNRQGKPRILGPAGGAFILANTPSDVRGLRNTMSDLGRWREDQLAAAEVAA